MHLKAIKITKTHMSKILRVYENLIYISLFSSFSIFILIKISVKAFNGTIQNFYYAIPFVFVQPKTILI